MELRPVGQQPGSASCRQATRYIAERRASPCLRAGSSRSYMAAFPTAGRYRLFLQFKSEGRIHTAAFTQEVSR